MPTARSKSKSKKPDPKPRPAFPEPLYPWLAQTETHWDDYTRISPSKNGSRNGRAVHALPMPTHKDLPETDGKPKENMYEPPQSMLLSSIMKPVLDRKHPDGDYVMAADSGIYWMAAKWPLEGCKSPDWFYIPGVPRVLDGDIRRSYVMWNEHVPPLLICEYVSGNGAEERDATPGEGKFWIYERRIKAKYYAIWDPKRNQLEAFERRQSRYRSIAPDAKGRYSLPDIGIKLGVWDGEYQGFNTHWLRAWDSRGRLLPTAEETAAVEKQRADAENERAEAEKHRAEAEKHRAETERRRAEAEKLRADQLAAKLRELGVDPRSL